MRQQLAVLRKSVETMSTGYKAVVYNPENVEVVNADLFDSIFLATSKCDACQRSMGFANPKASVETTDGVLLVCNTCIRINHLA